MAVDHKLTMVLELLDGVTKEQVAEAVAPLTDYLGYLPVTIKDGELYWESSGEVSWGFTDLVQAAVANLSRLVSEGGEAVLVDSNTVDPDAREMVFPVGTPEMVSEMEMRRGRSEAVQALQKVTGLSGDYCEKLVMDLESNSRAGIDMVLVSQSDLAIVVDLADSMVAEVESGLEDGTYEIEDNKGVGNNRAVVNALANLVGDSPVVGARNAGMFIGPITAVVGNAITQSIGQGQTVTHDSRNLDSIPMKGNSVTISYKDGVGVVVVREQGQGKGLVR